MVLIAHLGVIWLHKVPKLLHRDISANNIMYRIINSKVYGVLNNFDLAAPVAPTELAHEERTGTIPFMAIHLLESTIIKATEPSRQNDGDKVAAQAYSKTHLLWYDLESIYWVVLWLACQKPHDVAPHPLVDWSNCKMNKLVDKKKTILVFPTRAFIDRTVRSLWDWIEPIRIVLKDGHEKWNNTLNSLDTQEAMGDLEDVFTTVGLTEKFHQMIQSFDQ